ncbi:MAG: glycosyltransferase family A protein [Nocardioides sp.]|uniref:glycosyltransferase family A protein n=1 Tax=Nocardioides sp. TaxID=35761 RepID=UPI0039E5661D
MSESVSSSPAARADGADGADGANETDGAEERVPERAVDLSVVVTAHDETVVSGPTMRAADAAIAVARERGYRVEPIIVLDNVTEATRSFFCQPALDHWHRREYGEGDLGRVRNAVAPSCAGRYLAFLDADDLFSENWLAEGIACLDEAAAREERAIVHPELNIVFDSTTSMLVNIEPDSPLFTPHYLYVRNYYDSLGMAPREAHLEIPYVSRDIANGLSFQDFQFTIETMSRGWHHRVVRDTIIFKRRRDFSLVVESSNRKSIVRRLPEMAIDRIRDLGRSPR